MRYCFTICLLLSLVAVEAQEYQPVIYQAYLLEEMESWKEVMNQMEQDFSQTSDPALLYDLLEAEYGYTAWLVSVKRKKEAEELLKRAQRHMTMLTDMKLDDARVYSLKGAFYGFQIMLELRRAPSLGRLAREANEIAFNLDPEEPQVWLEKANMDYYRPAIFGGGKRKAVPMYERAVELFESSPGRTHENWLYINCLAGLGIAYEKAGKIAEAGGVYRKILALEPTFKWVREELYPRFREKHPGN
ncbi:MAG: tetratricopeptide repeat protein [Bacteroidales bacterium]|nr:tetratricopeptide repeat protein [Bacteroidales bacterium]